MNKAVFELRDVTYSYNSLKALNGLSLSIEEGQRVALLGANGSGKSTLLRILDGIYFSESGAVLFDGAELKPDLFEDDSYHFRFRRRVGLVFQNPDVQLFSPTVFDEVAFGPLQLRWSGDRIRREVEAILDRMEIGALKDRPPHQLSSGEMKRVALASVLILDPDVLLLDEPTAALDPRSQSQIIDLLVGWSDSRKTVITATHDLGLVEDIADYCFLLQAGTVVAKGPPAEILSNEELLHSANLIHAHRHRHADGTSHSHRHRRPHRHSE